MPMNRRLFVRNTAITAGIVLANSALAARRPSAAADPGSPKRKFTMDLRCGSLGVSVDQNGAIELAAKYGFESVAPEAPFLEQLSEAERREMPARLKEKNLVWGAAGLTVEFRKDETAFRDSLRRLPAEAKAMQQAGVTRVGTWLSPSHNQLTYVSNFRQHARRLKECVRILGDHGQRFGMEYVGPKTLWASGRHSFIHTLAETKDLIAEIGLSNAGVILDSWHWYTAHETVENLLTLKNSDIIACDLNDAPVGIAIDEQIDNQRELPAATGVIHLKGFLGALVTIGYDGPVRAEPFNAALNQLENEPAVAATATAMKVAFDFVR